MFIKIASKSYTHNKYFTYYKKRNIHISQINEYKIAYIILDHKNLKQMEFLIKNNINFPIHIELKKCEKYDKNKIKKIILKGLKKNKIISLIFKK